MKIVDDSESRIVDTFAARELHKLQPKITIDSYVDYTAKANYKPKFVQTEKKDDEA